MGTGRDWVEIQGGETHTCGIRLDHSLWCWGNGSSGQLGTGDDTDRLSPTQVGGDADWAQVEAGFEHTCGLRLDGTAWCWGSNQWGELGLGEGSERYVFTPTQVGVDADWAQIRLGYEHSCGLRVDHTLWCWGMNKYGQLGVGWRLGGHWDQRDAPTQVGIDADWAEVQGGYAHTCAVRLDQTLWCWGIHTQGQLGLGHPTKHRYLVPVPVGTASDWADLTAGSTFTCGIRLGQALWCWGYNGAGELGLDDKRTRFSPRQVHSGSSWTEISAGNDHTCGIRRNHTLWCWGWNADGELGLGDQHNRLVPTQV